ncbi:hypothetical protein NEMBOFW57_001164 [Staphylotrichum longicolle]|uniref:Heterokaryon incompatibility domain-containing protein n=1 Tax=Staphylotrichum longicolle TaxID=669026 RepID=A0AAD4I0K4_9PEZI|nr:hypothetical protein NEMBOFW57_001164 [Staphylotrichum longicolle]
MFPVARNWASSYLAPVLRSETQSYTTTYEYSGLTPGARTFRVLRLFPPRSGDQSHRDDFSAVLKGSIELQDLDSPDRHRYDALSYCWEGSIEPSPYLRQRKDRVIIETPDGRTSHIAISPALSTALRFIRARGQPLPLFVDQICINQADTDEKSQQVNLMGDIYRNCERVLAWLDVATKHSCPLEALEAALQFMVLARAVEHLEGARDPLERYQAAKWDTQAIHASLQSTMVMSRIFQDRAAALQPPGDARGQRLGRGLANLVQRFNVDIDLQGSWARLGSSDPKDHIYALKGLVSAGDPVASQLLTSYDQTVSAASVFNEFTRLSLDGTRGPPPIDYLLFSQMDTKREPGLRTWVPDWSTHIALPHGYSLGCHAMFNAGGGLRQPYSLAEVDVSKPGILKIKAVPLCQITQVGTHYMEHSTRLRRYAISSPDLMPRSIFNFFREARDLCKRASTQPNAASIPPPPPPPSILEDDIPGPSSLPVSGAPTPLDRAIWLTTTGGHGLTQTTEFSLLGRTIIDNAGNSQPLLGYLWNLQVEMDVFPTIMRRRREKLCQLAADLDSHSNSHPVKEATHTATTAAAQPGILRTLLTRPASWPWYLLRRLSIELVHLYRLWWYLSIVSYTWLRPEAEDMAYRSVYGVQDNEAKGMIGVLKSVLARHVRRRCFVSEQGHVGLGPVGMRVGDVVVVPVGASVPVVLRPGPGPGGVGDWTYVGEAYCHGFMDGEALKGGEAKDFEIG